MQKFTLRRRYFCHGTFGTLHRADGSQLCVIVECPWRNNKPFESCVPEGTYTLVPHNSSKYGNCYALESPNLGVAPYPPAARTHILIHKANAPSELQGCLATGMEFGAIAGWQEWCVLNSKAAFNLLMAELNSDTAQLTITKD